MSSYLYHRINREIIEERGKVNYELGDYLISRYNKPTRHKQWCSICSKDLEKGEDIIKIRAGNSRYGSYATFIYFHPYCYVIALKNKLKGLINITKKVRDYYIMEQL